MSFDDTIRILTLQQHAATVFDIFLASEFQIKAPLSLLQCPKKVQLQLRYNSIGMYVTFSDSILVLQTVFVPGGK